MKKPTSSKPAKRNEKSKEVPTASKSLGKAGKRQAKDLVEEVQEKAMKESEEVAAVD